MYQPLRYNARLAKKYFDTYVELSGLGTAVNDPAVASIVNIGTGSGNSRRLDNFIRVTNVNIHGTVHLSIATHTSQAAFSGRVRMIVYYDTRNNGAAVPCTHTDLLAKTSNVKKMDGTNGTAMTTPAVSSFRNYEEASRFKILADKIMEVKADVAAVDTPATPSWVTAGAYPFRLNKKCNLEVNYSTADGAAAAATCPLTEINAGNIGIAFFRESGTGWISNACRAELYARVKFTDN